MAIRVSSAKAKGRKLQQEVVVRLLAAYPQLGEDDLKSCSMGSQGADVWMSTAAKAAIPFDIECKARSGVALIYDALAQAKRHPDRTPLAIVKADRKQPLAVLTLDDLLALLTTI